MKLRKLGLRLRLEVAATLHVTLSHFRCRPTFRRLLARSDLRELSLLAALAMKELAISRVTELLLGPWTPTLSRRAIFSNSIGLT